MIKKESIPNLLTIARIAAIVPVCFLLYSDSHWLRSLAFVLFVASALTDFVDGWLARRWNIVSSWGRMLDPIADKLLVMSVLLMLVAVGQLSSWHLVAVMVIFLREIWVSGLREHLGQKGAVIEVSSLAKWKTTLQLVAIAVLILQFGVGWWLLWIASALTLWTGVEYTLGSVKTMNED